jgi:hypothetical protein
MTRQMLSFNLCCSAMFRTNSVNNPLGSNPHAGCLRSRGFLNPSRSSGWNHDEPPGEIEVAEDKNVVRPLVSTARHRVGLDVSHIQQNRWDSIPNRIRLESSQTLMLQRGSDASKTASPVRLSKFTPRIKSTLFRSLGTWARATNRLTNVVRVN